MKDPHFFLRRDKKRTEDFTDLLLGNLTDEEVSALLSEFIIRTGGITGERMVFRAVSSAGEPKEHIVAVFDNFYEIVRASIRNLSLTLKDCFLDFDGGNWKMVFLLA